MQYKFLGILISVVIGVPAIAMGSSFAVSVADGQTPKEALDTTYTRVTSILGSKSVTQTQVEATTSLEEATPPTKSASPIETANIQNSSACVTLKEGINDMESEISKLTTKTEEKKSLLAQVKSGPTDYEPTDEDLAEALSKIREKKEKLEADIATLDSSLKEIKEQQANAHADYGRECD